MPIAQPPLIVAGVDVGGLQKGFHAVAIRDGVYLDQTTARDAAQVAQWCRDIGAQVIGVDAPCRWSVTGRARPAERALMSERIWCFSTPTCSAALMHPKGHYNWMLAGAELFHHLEPAHPLYTGDVVPVGSPLSFETFPHAVTCALRGEVVSAKNKRKDRLAVLAEEGINLPLRPTMDTIDAAVCALAAVYLARNAIRRYGDVESGFIVVPTRQQAV